VTLALASDPQDSPPPALKNLQGPPHSYKKNFKPQSASKQRPQNGQGKKQTAETYESSQLPGNRCAVSDAPVKPKAG
jgi:hypothetical protein